MIERVDSISIPDDFRVLIDSSPYSAESTFRELDDVFLQTQARIWLGEVLHTRLDEETPIADLLADGKLLFQVSKVIWKMLLKKCMKLRHSKAYFSESIASGKNSRRYMPYSNIDTFLKICQTLGLTGIDLFSPSDVVEKRDIRRVCMCIRSLSKKARSKDLNVPDFDVVTYTVVMPTDMVGFIRRSLEQSKDRYSSSSDGYSPYMDGKPRYRQRSRDVGYAREYDSYAEGSDVTGSNRWELGFDSPSSTTSYDYVSLLISDAVSSPGGSTVIVENLLSTCGTPSSVQDQEENGHDRCHYDAISLAKAKCPPSTYCLFDDNHQFPEVLLDCRPSPSLICEKEGNSFCNDGAPRRAVCEPGNVLMQFSSVDLYQGSSASSVANSSNHHDKSERNLCFCQSGTLDFISHGIVDSESFYFCRGKTGGESDSDMEAAFPWSSSINKNLRCQLERRSSDKIENAKAHFTANLNFISDMSSVSGYESEMVKYGDPLDSLTSNTNKLQSDVKLDDVGSIKYLPTVECQMSTTARVVNPHSTCSEYVCYSPITFFKHDQWVSAANSTGADDMEVHLNVAPSVPAIRDGEKCSNCVTMSDSDLNQFNSEVNSSFNSVSYGSASKVIIGQQMPQVGFDVPEDKHVLPSSINIQSKEFDCLVPGLPQSQHRNLLLAKSSVKDSGNLLPDHLVYETETCPLGNGIGMCSVDHSGALEGANVLAINGQTWGTVYVSDPDSAVHHDEGGVVFLSMPTKEDDRGNPSTSSENDNKDHYYQHLANKNTLHATHQGFTDQETTHCVENTEKDKEDYTKVETYFGVSEKKSPKRELLKSVVGGVTLVGVFFFLFNLRRKSGEENVDERSLLSLRIGKGKHAEFSKLNRQKKGSVYGIYPRDKLRFRD